MLVRLGNHGQLVALSLLRVADRVVLVVAVVSRDADPVQGASAQLLKRALNLMFCSVHGCRSIRRVFGPLICFCSLLCLMSELALGPWPSDSLVAQFRESEPSLTRVVI